MIIDLFDYVWDLVTRDDCISLDGLNAYSAIVQIESSKFIIIY